MSASGNTRVSLAEAGGYVSLDELFRRLGHPPLTFEEWAANAPDVFESEAEVEEFMAFTHAARQRYVG